MNINNENDFVVHVRTPIFSSSKHVILGDDTSYSKQELSESKLSPRQASSQSCTYSDSFDSESPVKIKPITKDIGIAKKHPFKSSVGLKSKFSRNSFRNSVFKHNESTQKLLDDSRIKTNELVCENIDLKRKLLELTTELKTVQTQNKLQEKHLNKINGRDADIPIVLSKYTSEIHSLQEQLRMKKESFESTQKHIKELETEVMKLRTKNEKFRVLCEDKKVFEREELLRKLSQYQEGFELEKKKCTDLAKNLELVNKRHAHELSVESAKRRTLRQSYNKIIAEYRDIKSHLDEKSKLLEMQNIYSKKTVLTRAPPHRLSGENKIKPKSKSVSAGDQPQEVSPLRFINDVQCIHNDNIGTSTNKKKISVSNLSSVKLNEDNRMKTTKGNSLLDVKTALSHHKDKFNDELGQVDKLTKSSILYFGDSNSETNTEREETDKGPPEILGNPGTKFSSIHNKVIRQMTKQLDDESNFADSKLKSNNSNKENLLAKLKEIDLKNTTGTMPKVSSMKFDKGDNKATSNKSAISSSCDENASNDNSDIDDSESESDDYNPQGNIRLTAQGHAGLLASKGSKINSKTTSSTNKTDALPKFELLNFALKRNVNNNNTGSGYCSEDNVSIDEITLDK